MVQDTGKDSRARDTKRLMVEGASSPLRVAHRILKVPKSSLFAIFFMWLRGANMCSSQSTLNSRKTFLVLDKRLNSGAQVVGAFSSCKHCKVTCTMEPKQFWDIQRMAHPRGRRAIAPWVAQPALIECCIGFSWGWFSFLKLGDFM